MKFIDAEKKIKGIVGDNYHILNYGKTFHRDGRIVTICSIYSAPQVPFYSGCNWKEAFAKLEKAMDLKPIEETPGE